MTDFLTRFYPEATYGGFSDISGTMRFYIRVRSLLQPHFTVLDVGCGRGSHTAGQTELERFLRVFTGQAKHVIGIDVDPTGSDNSSIDEFRLITERQWPVESDSVDLLFSDWTMEHVEDPNSFFDECQRVLTTGGYLCIRTANRLGYIAFLSGLIPNRLHSKFLTKVQPNRESQDVFPTFYRCNTVSSLRRALNQRNFNHYVYGHEAEPSYLNFSSFAYLLGVTYQKLVPKGLGSTLYVFAQKKV